MSERRKIIPFIYVLQRPSFSLMSNLYLTAHSYNDLMLRLSFTNLSKLINLYHK